MRVSPGCAKSSGCVSLRLPASQSKVATQIPAHSMRRRSRRILASRLRHGDALPRSGANAMPCGRLHRAQPIAVEVAGPGRCGPRA